MKQINWHLLSIFQTLLFIMFINEEVAAKQFEGGIPIEISEGTLSKQVLTNEPIVLYGPSAETNFYYELLSDIAPKDNYVQLYVKNSKLLINPSSLTIKIDGEPVHSASLVGSEYHEIRLNLSGNALKKGIHTISVGYTGQVKEGICVPQSTTGNWLTIQINSFINLDTLSSNLEVSLKDYPRIYTGTPEHPIDIIIPSNPSNQSLQGAHIIANYLTSISLENTISILNENEVKKINGNIVIVGGSDEFETHWVKQVMANEILQVQDGSLYISNLQLQQNTSIANALIVLANHPKDLSEKAVALTRPTYYQQMVGKSVQIRNLPPIEKKQSTIYEVSLNDFGLTDVLLDNMNTKTHTYFYYMPVDKHVIENPSLQLRLKRSDIISSYDDSKEKDDTSTAIEGKVELLVYINGVPHAVDIQSLAEDENGNLVISIPVDANILEDSRLLSLQIEASGLRIENPCISTDSKKWLYVFDDSKLVLPTVAKNNDFNMYFNNFPFPFANHSEEVFIILPNHVKVSNEEMQNLYEALTTNNQLPKITLLSTSEVTEDHLKQGHVIFIGAIAQHKILQSMDNKLIIKYQEMKPQLEKHGFIQSEVDFYSFIQQNPWNEEKYKMVVFDRLHDLNEYFSKDLLSFLRSVDKPVSIVVQTGIDKFFTNAEQVVSSNEGNNNSNEDVKQQNGLFIWIFGFIALIIVLVVLIISFNRRKKSL